MPTPSTVSQQLKILEREAGIPLTERVGWGIVLTSAGRALAQTATDVATAIEKAEALWNDFRESPRGEVTMTIFPTGGEMLLPGLLHSVDRLERLKLYRIEAANGAPAKVAQRLTDDSIVEAVVAAGHGIAILPRFTTRNRENGLITRPLKGVPSSRLISALLRPDRAERSSVRAVVKALVDEATRFEREHTIEAIHAS